MLRHFPILLTFTLLLSNCGSANLNSMLESKERQEAVDSLLQEAQYDYDKGKFQSALKKAQKAKTIRPDGEHATVLLGYIHLGLAGLETISLAKGLVKEDDDDADQDKTAGTFAKLASVIGLGEADLIALSTETKGGESEADDPLVYLPKTTPLARISDSGILQNLDAAISYLCPFISPEAKLLAADSAFYDERHDNCDIIETAGQMRAQAHFAWAIAHLGEAITFYSLIFYRDAGNSEPNIVERAKQIDQFKSTPSVYLKKIVELSDLVDSIFPTDADNASDAMLNAIFDNLETTGRGFGAISGLPDSFTKSVDDALSNVRGKLGNIQNPTAADNNQAMKNSLTKSLSQQLFNQIQAGSATSEGELNEICCSYFNINSDAALPAKCPSKEQLKTTLCAKN